MIEKAVVNRAAFPSICNICGESACECGEPVSPAIMPGRKKRYVYTVSLYLIAGPAP
jgi:hypothetical protein